MSNKKQKPVFVITFNGVGGPNNIVLHKAFTDESKAIEYGRAILSRYENVQIHTVKMETED